MKPLLPIALLLAACTSTADLATSPMPRPPKGIDYSGELMPAFHVTDFAMAKAWYRDVLGFEVVFDLPEQEWCELSLPTKDAVLGLSGNPESTGSGDAFVSFSVHGIEAAQAALVAKGVRLDGELVVLPEMVKLLYFFDPDGNRMLFYEPFQPSR